MKSPRFAFAALISGLASWVLPLLLIAYGFATDTGYDQLGARDDAPSRAGFMLLVLSPVFILGMSVFYAVVGGALRFVKRESLSALVAVSGLAALLIGVVFAEQGFAVGGASDAAMSFGIFGFGSFVCLVLGSLAWVRYAP